MTGRQSVLESISQIAAAWLNPEDALTRQASLALQVSTGRSPEAVRLALHNAFIELDLVRLQEFARALPDSHVQHRGRLLVLAPATVYTAWLPDAVTAWLLGYDVWVKASQSEPVFPAAFQESLKRWAPTLADRFRVLGWRHGLLREADAVVVYGSNDTVNQLRGEVSPNATYVGRGSRLSVAVLFEEVLAEDDRAVQALLRVQDDLQPFGLEGCLSPQFIFVGARVDWVRSWFANRAGAIPEIRSFTRESDLEPALVKLKPYLSCIGWGGAERRFTVLTELGERLGASRVCSVGDMQRPPLSWVNGTDLVKALLKREPGATLRGSTEKA